MEEAAGLRILSFSATAINNKSTYTQMQRKITTNLHPNITKFGKIDKHGKNRVKFGDFVELI